MSAKQCLAAAVLLLSSQTALGQASPASYMLSDVSLCDNGIVVNEEFVPVSPLYPLGTLTQPTVTDWQWGFFTVGTVVMQPLMQDAVRAGAREWSNTDGSGIQGHFNWSFMEDLVPRAGTILEARCNGLSDVILLSQADFLPICGPAAGACTRHYKTLGASHIDSFDIYLTVEHPWNSVETPTYIDPFFETSTMQTMLHEFGHAFGFRHDEFWPTAGGGNYVGRGKYANTMDALDMGGGVVAGSGGDNERLLRVSAPEIAYLGQHKTQTGAAWNNFTISKVVPFHHGAPAEGISRSQEVWDDVHSADEDHEAVWEQPPCFPFAWPGDHMDLQKGIFPVTVSAVRVLGTPRPKAFVDWFLVDDIAVNTCTDGVLIGSAPVKNDGLGNPLGMAIGRTYSVGQVVEAPLGGSVAGWPVFEIPRDAPPGKLIAGQQYTVCANIRSSDTAVFPDEQSDDNTIYSEEPFLVTLPGSVLSSIHCDCTTDPVCPEGTTCQDSTPDSPWDGFACIQTPL